jgi:hypothetical protein
VVALLVLLAAAAQHPLLLLLPCPTRGSSSGHRRPVWQMILVACTAGAPPPPLPLWIRCQHLSQSLVVAAWVSVFCVPPSATTNHRMMWLCAATVRSGRRTASPC